MQYGAYSLVMRATRRSPMDKRKIVYESRRMLPYHPIESMAMTEAILDRQGLMLNRAAYFGWRENENLEWWVEQI